MNAPFFVQVHALVPYGASLINRDRNNLAKRLSFGGTVRQRISSQCLKKAWREQDGEGSLRELGQELGQPLSVRSAKIFSDLLPGAIAKHLAAHGTGPATEIERAAWAGYAATVLESLFSSKAGDEDKKSQIIVMGEAEIDALLRIAAEMWSAGYDVEAHWRLLSKQGAEPTEIEPSATTPAATPADKKSKKTPEEKKAERETKRAQDDAVKEAKKAFGKLLGSQAVKEILEAVKGHAGIDGALMGRMITADQFTRVDAAIGVSHAFTVHPIESVSDFFSATDTISTEPGASMLGETELTSGLFYHYAVLDLRAALKNLKLDPSPETIDAIVSWFVGSFTQIKPAAKFGSTAAVSAPVFFMAEWGNRQPINLDQAFRETVRGSTNHSQEAVAAARLVTRAADFDRMIAKGWIKRAGVAVSDIADQVGDKLKSIDMKATIPEVVDAAVRDAVDTTAGAAGLAAA